MGAPMKTWRDREAVIVLMEDMTGLKNEEDGIDAEPGEAVSESEGAEMGTGLAVRVDQCRLLV